VVAGQAEWVVLDTVALAWTLGIASTAISLSSLVDPVKSILSSHSKDGERSLRSGIFVLYILHKNSNLEGLVALLFVSKTGKYINRLN